MADFEPPSFSLGLDDELDSEPNSTPVPIPSPKRAKRFPASLRTIAEDNDDDFELPGPGPDPKCTDPPPTLKRLRRGPTSCKPTPPPENRNVKEEKWRDVEDEIEEFSSQEDRPEGHPKIVRSVCSSSKIPLHRHGEFSSQLASQSTVKRRREDTDSLAFENMEKSDNKFVSPKLTVSPLRRFQLIDSDSDSDDPSIIENRKKDEKVESPGQCAVSNKQSTAKTSHAASQTDDLWKGFMTDKDFHIATPALDEVCDEYFRSMRGRDYIQNVNEGYHPKNSFAENSMQQRHTSPLFPAHRSMRGRNDIQNANEGYNPKNSFTENCMQQRHTSPLFPAHNYFFHNDLRIQKLVQDRLRHFFPLSANNSQGSKQNEGSVDYIGQFSLGGRPEKRTVKVAAEASSSKGKKKNKPNEASQADVGWMNPKNSAGVPKDAGKRRVHAAVGKSASAGHWFTDADGKRVYVTKNGQELTGQIAYRHYKKESGGGFKKSKKKATANKKSSANNKKR
nr:Rho GTPase-activating protein like [Ipomoea batatas]